MRVAFTKDQNELTAAVREMLVSTCTPADLRRLLESPDAVDEQRWSTAVEMGILGVLVPEEQGGLGLSVVDFVGIAEAAGYVALPEPLVELAGVVAPCLALAEQDRGWLERVLAGELVAVADPTAPWVVNADVAKALLLVADESVHLVDASSVKTERDRSFDQFRRLFKVRWEPGADTDLQVGCAAMRARGTLFAAAQLLGLAQRCIDISVGYAKERTQFGRAIGVNQAVKHHLATAQVKVEFARPVVHAAAAELALGNLAAEARLAHAKISAAAAADYAAEIAVQVHGAMGYTWEADVHFFLKRAFALKYAWGDPALQMGRVIERLNKLPTGPDLTFASEVGR